MLCESKQTFVVLLIRPNGFRETVSIVSFLTPTSTDIYSFLISKNSTLIKKNCVALNKTLCIVLTLTSFLSFILVSSRYSLSLAREERGSEPRTLELGAYERTTAPYFGSVPINLDLHFV